jgi:sortase A
VDDGTARRRGDRRRAVARGLGDLLVTVGVVLLLFVVYEVYVTDLLTERRQAELTEELQAAWAEDPPVPGSQVPGDAIAVLHIPRLGDDYRQVVLEGTAEEQLSQGPGHYVGTALPGEQGNLAIAGHRVGKGSPFLELDTMRAGDPIVVETAQSWFVYRVLPLDGEVPGQQIVRPTQVDVIAPVPGGAAFGEPDGAYLTLTTCHPRFSAEQRLVVHAVLDGPPTSKADAPDGPPAVRER